MTTNDTRHTRLLIGLGVVAAILLAKIFSIQVLDDHYKIDADNNTTVREIIYPTRGVIYDRNGDILVGNKVAYDILVNPRDLEKVEFDTLAWPLPWTPRWNSSAGRCRNTGRTAGRSDSRA